MFKSGDIFISPDQHFKNKITLVKRYNPRTRVITKRYIDPIDKLCLWLKWRIHQLRRNKLRTATEVVILDHRDRIFYFQ